MPIPTKLSKKKQITPIILVGGSGKRLWPLSQKKVPKTLLNLMNHSTLLQTTLSRIKKLPFSSRPLVIGHHEQGAIIAQQSKKITQKITILLEAESRNTAPAAAIAAMYAIKNHTDRLLLILPADHVIPDASLFTKMINQATEMAFKGKLVVFGVVPSYPETNYGYIKKGKKLKNGDGWSVESFKEKPNLKTATSFFKSKSYYWNSGIFLFRASTFLAELKKHAPKVYHAAKNTMQNLHGHRNIMKLDGKSMKDCPNISIDKAIFEKTNQAVLFPFTGKWCDIGDWNALYTLGKKDFSGNVKNKNVAAYNSKNCYLYSNQQLLVTSGIDDCVVIVTPQAVLVARRDKKLDLKKIVNHLIEKKLY